MVEGAARLVDFILPAVPVRQWVLSLPVPLRFVLAYDAQLCSLVLSVFIREVFRYLSIPADLRDREQTGGFDIHARRRVSGDDRSGLERLCRYLLHPPLAHDRLSFTPTGRVRLEFARPWRNGVDAMELDPHNFIARLVPLVPAPGTHQLRYFGVLAARSALRQKVT